MKKKTAVNGGIKQSKSRLCLVYLKYVFQKIRIDDAKSLISD